MPLLTDLINRPRPRGTIPPGRAPGATHSPSRRGSTHQRPCVLPFVHFVPLFMVCLHHPWYPQESHAGMFDSSCPQCAVASPYKNWHLRKYPSWAGDHTSHCTDISHLCLLRCLLQLPSTPLPLEDEATLGWSILRGRTQVNPTATARRQRSGPPAKSLSVHPRTTPSPPLLPSWMAAHGNLFGRRTTRSTSTCICRRH